MAGSNGYQEVSYDALGGFNDTLNPADIPQGKGDEGWDGVLRMAQAQNVYAPYRRYDLMTLPGFDARRATAINAAGIFTGGVFLDELAAEEILAVSIAGSSHNYYRNNANPPGAITGGANPTIGRDNLVNFVIFHDGTNPGVFAFTRLRDTVQFFTAAISRSSKTISGTTIPQFGEVFGQRLLLGAPSVGGTVYDDRVYWTDIRDGDLITNTALQFESFETAQKDRVRALKRLGDVCLVGKLHNVFLMAVSPNFSKPFNLRELPNGRNRGPVSHHGVVEADSKLFWMGQHDIHSLDLNGVVNDLASPFIRATITGLQDDEREFCCAGHYEKEHTIWWAVSASGSAVRNRLIGYNYDTKQFSLSTRTRNAFWNYTSGEQDLLSGGGEIGLFYQEFTSATGDADSETGAIDADIFTPRFHCSFPSDVKLFVGFKITFAKQASEAVTVQYRLNDATTWSTFGESPYTVVGTAGNVDVKFFRLMKAGTHCQLRIRDATSGEQLRVQGITVVYQRVHMALVS